ncbi:hypothetical protein J8Z24_09595 [Pseudoalteromonas sp. SCSIO 43201]|uniref:RAMP superfamily CRISPR-associated protein n=1 Tax=Pseudoalteromonas sp. SCSIO 43201 TaxID=2822842 RepID=UPI0020756BA1|nr:RAMP superfamily CRISPR-associated protein [Pseudoalteromonas sp. SCSIO 43201]USD27240.1 hypothetical protein J8Z24_09595 [Pseudoalteromonas sp. SCSIO 43201]
MIGLTLARIVIETQTPLAIHSGLREDGFDTQLARDANGLPYIPGTSIAGVWLHLAKQHLQSKVNTDEWFGSIKQRSLLKISNGVLIDSKGKLVKGLILPSKIKDDTLLNRLAQASPHHRERVAINDRGVAEGKAKYDQILLPKGIRFCVDIRVESQQLNTDEWQQLLSLWHSRLFALGADTRNGLGQIKVIGVQQTHIDLSDLSGTHPTDKISDFFASPLPTTHTLSQQETPLIELQLEVDGYWRFGRGATPLNQSDHDAAMLSYSEPSVTWQNGTPSWQVPKPVLCGSAIKGILAHRTAFHYNRITARFAETLADATHQQWQARPNKLADLFGTIEDDQESLKKDSPPKAGRLIVEDSPIEYKPEQVAVRYHNSIDRFTGGVRRGALFSEELLYEPTITIRIWLLGDEQVDHKLLQAFEATINDLTNGLLSLGAGAGRGTSLIKPSGGFAKGTLAHLSLESGQ